MKDAFTRSMARLDALMLPAAMLAFWWAVTEAELISRIYLPSPASVAEALYDNVVSSQLTRPVVDTAWRMLIGWFLASIIGIALGAAIALNPTARAVLGPTLELMRPLPASAIIPVAVLALGLTNKMVIFVIAFGSLWPVLLSTMTGFRGIEPRLREVAAALELSRSEYLWKIAFRSAAPDIIAGLRLGLTLALILCIVAEMISLTGGIGSEILLASRSFRSADLYAGIAVIGAMGFLLNRGIIAVENRLLRWRTGH
jgi:sulfonate transport system permease protein